MQAESQPPSDPLADTYADRQSLVVGTLFLTVGCLSVVFGIVGVAVVFKLRFMTVMEMDFRGISAFGVTCSVVVGIRSY